MVHPDIDEALRYAGVPAPDEAMRQKMTVLAREVTAAITPKHTWKQFPLIVTDNGYRLSNTDILLSGHSADSMLAGCSDAVLLVCTLGIAFDTLLRTREKQDMAEAILLNGLGGALVEAVCNETEKEIAGRNPGKYLTDRFSPGYGDLPLSLQPSILQATDALRRTGITVTPTFLMNPSKSVTAVIGLADTPQPAKIRGCSVCSLHGQCAFRKRGQTCA